MSSIEIRPTVPADLADLAEVLVQVHKVDGYPVEGVANPRAWVDLPDAIGQWTALADDRPVGHVALLRPDFGDGAPGLLAAQEDVPMTRIAALSRLFVGPTARRHSLGSGLVGVAEQRARDMGLRLTLDVMQKDRAARALYRRRGWRSLGTFQHNFGVDRSIPAAAFVAPYFE